MNFRIFDVSYGRCLNWEDKIRPIMCCTGLGKVGGKSSDVSSGSGCARLPMPVNTIVERKKHKEATDCVQNLSTELLSLIVLLLRALYKLTKIGYFEPNSIGYCQLVWCSE
jgi:hypothetical protein